MILNIKNTYSSINIVYYCIYVMLHPLRGYYVLHSVKTNYSH